MTVKIVNIAMAFTVVIGMLTFGFLVWKLLQLVQVRKEVKPKPNSNSNPAPKPEPKLNPEPNPKPNLVLTYGKRFNMDTEDIHRRHLPASDDKKNDNEDSDDNKMLVSLPAENVYFHMSREQETALLYPGSVGAKSYARLKFIKIANLPSKRVEFLIKRETSLGRSSKEDIFLDDKYVSGHHAVFLFDGTVLKLMDTESTNGTFLNGQKIKENTPTAISSRAIVVMGATSFLVEKL